MFLLLFGLLYLRLYCSIIHRTGETIWHFAAFVSRLLLLLLFLLNTFTTSDTTSMSATLTFNRISVKSVKRKREAVLGCECFEWRLFMGGLLVHNPWKVVLNEFRFMQILFLTRWNILPSKYLECLHVLSKWQLSFWHIHNFQGHCLKKCKVILFCQHAYTQNWRQYH